MDIENTPDTLFADPRDRIVDFVFDESVARVFSDMIRRSVPGFESITAIIGMLAEHYVQPQSNCYDLGCSLGAATLSIRSRLRKEQCRIIAIDNSPAMVERCRENIGKNNGSVPVEIICADIQDVRIQNASIVVLNFTLQFIALERRLELLKNIYKGLRRGGVLILSEKITFSDRAERECQESLHAAFKQANGYSQMEISQKRTALENILIPNTLEEHKERLQLAGFENVQTWFQCFNFASLLAIK